MRCTAFLANGRCSATSPLRLRSIPLCWRPWPLPPLADWTALPPLLLDATACWLILGLGFLSTMLAFLLYTRGLQVVESSRAAILATLEPVVAALTSILLFGETLSSWQFAGIGLVLAAVLLVQKRGPAHKGVRIAGTASEK
ncbi:DMT family transporter [Cesiribacter andamanensis]|uniref:DMT family transporter n=1 Tax=Cesiribacter andamanensis TaxID=649507 RepID=UPI00373FCEF3